MGGADGASLYGGLDDQVGFKGRAPGRGQVPIKLVIFYYEKYIDLKEFVTILQNLKNVLESMRTEHRDQVG
jgi:hypothetical protein